MNLKVAINGERVFFPQDWGSRAEARQGASSAMENPQLTPVIVVSASASIMPPVMSTAAEDVAAAVMMSA